MSETIISKPCSKCKLPKPLSEFPKRSDSKDGHRNECKLCESQQHKTYYLNVRQAYCQTEEGKQAACEVSQRFRQKHPLRIKATLKRHRLTEKYRIRQKRYQEGEKYKATCKRYRNSEAGRITQEKYRKANHIKYNAKAAVFRAIKSGQLPRPDTLKCSCGKQAKQYHHHKGYAKKHHLDVIAFCVPCHGETRKIS